MLMMDSGQQARLLLATTLLAVSAIAQDDNSMSQTDPANPATGQEIATDLALEEEIATDLALEEEAATDLALEKGISEVEAMPDEAESAALQDETRSEEVRTDDILSGPLDQVVPVAEENIEEEPVEDGSVTFKEVLTKDDSELTDIERLLIEFERYKQLMRDGVYDEADTVAKRIVQMAAQTSGPRSLEMAKALTNLAIVQHRNQEFVPAQQNYLASIEIIEDADNRLSSHLVNPLKGLGSAQLDAGRPDLAHGTFKRAVHITHVNEGPHNPYQLELLQSLAEVNLRLGETDDAKDLQDRMYMLNVRQHDPDTMELVPTLVQRARWQHRAGLIIDERTTYRRIIQIVEKNAGKDSLLLVQPLISYGKSYFYTDMSGTVDTRSNSVNTGEIFFKRALRITEASPESQWKIRATTKLALGDYYMYIGHEKRGRKVYVDAWQDLSIGAAALDFREKNMERLVLLDDRPLPKYISSDSDRSSRKKSEELLTASLTVSFKVNNSGRVSAVEVIDASPPDFTQMLRAVHRNLRTRVYRPRYKNAKPVATPSQSLVHEYFYRQSDLDALRPSQSQQISD
jgi:hypothetical protein